MIRQRIRGVFAVLAALTMALNLVSGAGAAEGALTLQVNGRITVSDTPPVLTAGRVLVPVRFVAETLGLAVEWDDATQTAYLRGGGRTIELQPGSAIAVVDGRLVALDAPPQLLAGRVMVPLRLIARTVGARVTWDAATQTVSIDIRAGEGSGETAPGIRPDQHPWAPPYDIAILGGRVMDPETGYDAIANVGIQGDRIAAVTLEPIRGATEIDATGLVVAPGFIDILSYDPNPYGIWYKIADGVTTNLGMHGLGVDADAWLRYWEQAGSPAHFGGAFSHLRARERLGLGPYQSASSHQVQELARMAAAQIEAGWIGIDISLEYAPGTSYQEVLALAQVAARHGVPVFFHARYSDMEPPGTNFEALAEILQVARESGAAVHVEHINSTGGTFSMPDSLGMLAAARAEGLEVTACVYPYHFWATYLGSARFDPGWQERFHIGYADLEIAGTGERLTPESFARYRAQNKLAVAYAIPEEDVRTALQSPFVMIGSDAILEPGNNNHPRAAGTYARVLGRYVREEGVLSLMEALRKMTILPAQRLEAQAPALRTRGRLRAGMDADITVFDPSTVRDRATVRNPAQASVGIPWVLVAGEIVKDPNGVRREVQPGRAIRYSPPAAGR